jgi:hypothetical protein
VAGLTDVAVPQGCAYARGVRYGATVVALFAAVACGPRGLPPTAPSRARFEEVAAAARARFEPCTAMARGVRNAVPDMPQGELIEAFDWDGDGCPEIVVVTDGELAIWTYREGRTERYAPSETLTFDGVEDVDSDGRPDLVDHRFTRERPDCLRTNQARIGGPIVVLHSMIDGTFAENDEVARAHLLRQCPNPPKRLLVGKAGTLDPDRSLRNIACARLWGATGEQVEAQVLREWPQWRDDYHAQSARNLPCFWSYDLVRQADIEPPLALY